MNNAGAFEPCCLSTTIGSLPHTDVALGTSLIFTYTPEIPSWVQFPRRDGRENMMIQFTEGLPGIASQEGKVRFDTASPRFTEEVTAFYEHYLAVMEEGRSDELRHFEITPEYAAGFREYVDRIPQHLETLQFLKGQVTGPFTLGINISDEHNRCSYYDKQLRDVVVKSVAMKALWQLNVMKSFGKRMFIFIDEPSLLAYGSQMFITVSREDILSDINEVVDAIHSMGGLAGIHCEEDTDWSLLMETRLDVLDFDAYDHLQAITLYPAELRRFLDRGGFLGWGMVPTLDREAAASETLDSLLEKFEQGLRLFERKHFERELIMRRALITPSCGAGGVLSEELAVRVLGLLQELSLSLRKQGGF
jgi:hypothetical protein